MKYDNDKPKIHLVPPEAIIEAAKVFGFGAEKYGENNWRQDIEKFPVSRHYSSIQRHLLAYMSGEDQDPESGLPHLSQALTQMMILVMTTIESDPIDTDDRFKK
jgi:hypothetical protein